MSQPFKNFFRPLYEALHAIARWLPFSSQYLGRPRRWHSSTPEWIAARRPKNVNYTEIDPAQTLRRHPPHTLDSRLHWKFVKEGDHDVPGTFFVEIPGARVWGPNGAVITPDDRVLWDLSFEHGVSVERHPIFEKKRLERVHRLEGRAAVLSVVGANHYFHWMLDLLPRFDLLVRGGAELASIDWFIVNGASQPFQKESLARLGVPPRKIIDSSQYPHLKPDVLLAPSLSGSSGNMTSRAAHYVSELFVPQGPPGGRSRLFLSRSDAKYRKLTNEAEISVRLRKRGFKTVTLSSLSVSEQAKLLGTAEAIVAPHGGGLSNLVFAAAGAKVIECFAPTYVNACYYALSEVMELDYSYLLGTGASPDPFVDPHLITDDMTIDPFALDRLLDRAGL